MYTYLDTALLYFVEPQYLEVEGRDNRFQIVHYRSGETNQEYHAIEDTETGDYYWNNTPFLVAQKCFAIFCATPLHLPASMIWNTLKIPYHMAHACLGNPQTALTQNIADELWNIARAPYYALGIELGAIKGMIETLYINETKAYEARNAIASIERAWKYDIPLSNDCRRGCIGSNPQLIETFYLAACFQPYFNINTLSIRAAIRETGRELI